MSDIGVSMGGLGSDAAIEASDLVLMSDEPSKLVDAIKIARKTHKIVWQNIIIVLIIKFAVLALAIIGKALCGWLFCRCRCGFNSSNKCIKNTKIKIY